MRDGMRSVFPRGFVEECLKAYERAHGKPARVIAFSNEDFLDYHLTATLPKKEWFTARGVEVVTTNEELKPGEVDLAVGIREEAAEPPKKTPRRKRQGPGGAR